MINMSEKQNRVGAPQKREIKASDMKALQIRLTQDKYRLLKRYSVDHDTSMQLIIEQLVDKFLLEKGY